MRALILGLTLIAASAIGQNAAPQPHPKKILTPDQIVYQHAVKIHNAAYDQLRTAALSAFNTEVVREKTLACPAAGTTIAINQCLSRESDLTDANCKSFSAAIRAMLALPYPQSPGEPEVSIGPTGPEGTPATETAAFDKAQVAWQAYSEAQRSFVDTLWRGGTIVNAMVLECGLRISRARLHELNDEYDLQLRH